MTKSREYRIYGPPGTGKTTYIAKRATELADDYGADQISICSLTRAAVREVAGRDLPIPEENITTLHARCKRALMAGKPAESQIKEFAKKHPDYASTECLPPGLARGVEQDENMDEVILAGAGITLYEHSQILRQQLIPVPQWSPRVALWHSVWDEWCRDSGLLDFTGWLEQCRGGGVLPPQQVLFVDEAQDHTPLQLEVIRAWDVRHRFLVGDDDQNLYEWSGAIPQKFLSYEIPASREMVLSQSYRVPRQVHSLATRWISMARFRKHKEYMPRDYEGEVEYSDYRILDAKSMILPEGVDQPGHRTMILASCSYMLSDIIAALKREGIPIHNPYRRADAHWNPLGKTLQIVRSLMVGDRNWTGHEAARWAAVLAEKRAFYRGCKTPFIDACRGLGAKPISEKLLMDLMSDDAADLAISQDPALFERMRMTGTTGDWPYTLRVVREYGPEVEPWLIVGTIHSVKGGEADEVILFPDLSPAGYTEYASQEHRDRILRLYYVGMTRARDRLVLCERSAPRAVDWI
jgi:DNA helicase-2/ATP-dependent DNA helicase PcrA